MAATQVSREQTVALATAPGQRLRADAAAAWDAAVRAFGSTVLLTDSYRPYDVQERIFRDRYRQGNHRGKPGYTTDVRYWQGQPWTRRAGTAAAAVPGTSNHGSGRAVDVKTRRAAADPAHPAAVVFTSFSDADRLRFLEVARPYGWADDEGRSVSEHWHLTYYPARDTHPAPPRPAPTPAPTPVPDVQEDDMRMIQNTATKDVYLVIPGIGVKYIGDSKDVVALKADGVPGPTPISGSLAAAIGAVRPR